MQKNTASANPITDGLRALIDRLAAALDPDYPALVIAPRDGGISDGARYAGREKPDFVRADDEGWKPL